MSAVSGGDWSDVVKSISSSSNGNVSKDDVKNIVNIILARKSDIVQSEEKYDQFLSPFAVLACNYFAENVETVEKLDADSYVAATKVLLDYLVLKLKKYVTKVEDDALGRATERFECAVSVDDILTAIKAVCTGSKCISRTVHTKLVSGLKNSAVPQLYKTFSEAAAAKKGTVKDTKPHVNLLSLLQKQLVTPYTFDSDKKKMGDIDTDEDEGIASREMVNFFVEKCTKYLRNLHAGDLIVDYCYHLSALYHYVDKYMAQLETKSFTLPGTYNDAVLIKMTLPLLVRDVTVFSNALSVSVIEPLTQEKLRKLSTLSSAVLYCSAHVATALSIIQLTQSNSPKTSVTSATVASGAQGAKQEEDNAEVLAAIFVEKSIKIFNELESIIKKSAHIGGQVLQNHYMIGAYTILSSLMNYVQTLTAFMPEKVRDEKTKSTHKSKEKEAKVNWMRGQQGFNNLALAMLKVSLNVLSHLFTDVSGECMEKSELILADLDIMQRSFTLQRIARVMEMEPNNFIYFLLHVAPLLYRKACSLKRLSSKRIMEGGDAFSLSDSTTYYEDDLMACSDESTADDDDDSEPILGHWLEETMSSMPEETAENTESDDTKPSDLDSDRSSKLSISQKGGPSIVPNKGDPSGYMTAATEIFNFLNQHVILSDFEYITDIVKSNFTDQHYIIVVSALIGDLDRETGLVVAYFGPELTTLYRNFSMHLMLFSHNLLVRGVLSESSQNFFLTSLGISPFTSSTTPWPLMVYPRSLSILTHVLLLRTNRESACINIWQRFIYTLEEHIVNQAPSREVTMEDMNIEHAHLLIFLFNSLTFMQKKGIVFSIRKSLADITSSVSTIREESQFMYLARLILFLDYMIKHLYDPPDFILEQVQYNTIGPGLHGIVKSQPHTDGKRRIPAMFNLITNVKNTSASPIELTSGKFSYYDLSCYEYTNQESPKLDGLTLSFLLNNSAEQQSDLYSQMISTLIAAVNKVNVIRVAENQKGEFLCAVQYCCMLAWRLLLQLPPGVEYIEKMLTYGRQEKPDHSAFTLYMTVWGPRCDRKLYYPWLKDVLVKQPRYKYAEGIYASVADVTDSLPYLGQLVKIAICHLLPKSEEQGILISREDFPQFYDIMLCDVLLSRLHARVNDKGRFIETDIPPDVIKTSSGQFIRPEINEEIIYDLMPYLIRLMDVVLVYIRSSLLHMFNEIASTSESMKDFNLSDLTVMESVISISGYYHEVVQSGSRLLFLSLPSMAQTVIERWTNIEIPYYLTNVYRENAENAPESYMLAVIDFHLNSLSNQKTFTINPSLKHLLYSVVMFVNNNLNVYKLIAGGTKQWSQLGIVLCPIFTDIALSYLNNHVHAMLSTLVGVDGCDILQIKLQTIIFEHLYTVILNFTSTSSPCSEVVSNKVIHEAVQWLTRMLHERTGRAAVNAVLCEKSNNPDYGLHTILLSIVGPRTKYDCQYMDYVLDMFNKLFAITEEYPEEICVKRLISSLLCLQISTPPLTSVLKAIVLGPVPLVPPEQKAKLESEFPSLCHPRKSSLQLSPNYAPFSDVTFTSHSQKFLENVASYISKENSVIKNAECTAYIFMECLLPVATSMLVQTESPGFPELFRIILSFANVIGAEGHFLLLETICSKWIVELKEGVKSSNVKLKLVQEQMKGSHVMYLDSMRHVLDYVADVITAFCPSTKHGTSIVLDNDLLPPVIDMCIDWPEEIAVCEPDDGESSLEETDEDNLSNKLCTFTITQKEFMNQHWYHCHTCKMTDKVGVCSVCARVCHKGHDVTYAKFGNFFCDCGAKTDGSCKALTKRSTQAIETAKEHDGSPSGDVSVADADVSAEEKSTSPESKQLDIREVERLLGMPSLYPIVRDKQHIPQLAKTLGPERKERFLYLLQKKYNVINNLLDVGNSFMPMLEELSKKTSVVGCYRRAEEAMLTMHSSPKIFEFSDKLMIPTLGSQEGALETLRPNFSGDQGQTIRQLLSAHLIRRVTMTCVSSRRGKRQFLVTVSSDKGKLTVLQLSSLLKQADTSKKKITLTRLSSTPIPFTILSVTSNPCCNEFLAVCGLKDCHVLTLNNAGGISEHLILHPQLESGNFIIRCIWLPGSQTLLALVTADFVKIYDLSKDVLSPQHYFLVPTGKIRDVTFIVPKTGPPIIVIMSSVGYIYTQELNFESLAEDGPFYVTNTLTVEHPLIKDVNGQLCAGGISVYYSHVLQMLFFSYASGKSFMGYLQEIDQGVTVAHEINITQKGSGILPNGSNKSNGSGSTATSPLCYWTEVTNHPGLIFAVTQSVTGNGPFVIMINPEKVVIQEIKPISSKLKILDTAIVRYPVSQADFRTSLIVLNEDGSLRIYNASTEQTGFWLSPTICPQNIALMENTKCRRRKRGKSSKQKSQDNEQNGDEKSELPVDFFEHCTPLTDVEFGGNDLLQVYNAAQIKHRLNTPGLYVVSTKPGGFVVKVTNSDDSHVICGVRILLGVQEASRSPSYIEILDKHVRSAGVRNRWFDIPLSKQQALIADNNLSIMFGPSQDPDDFIVVDSIKVYGRSKEQFGWPEDTEEIANTLTPAGTPPALSPNSSEIEFVGAACTKPLLELDRFFCSVMNVVESYFTLINTESSEAEDEHVEEKADKSAKQSVFDLCMPLLTTIPSIFPVQLHAKNLLASVFKSRSEYYEYKDKAMLDYIYLSILKMFDVDDACEIDPEEFYFCLLSLRSIATSRPSNFWKFVPSKYPENPDSYDDPRTWERTGVVSTAAIQLVNDIMRGLFRLYGVVPKNSALAAVAVPGLKHMESTAFAVIEILHSLATAETSDDVINFVVANYMDMLLCGDMVMSFSARLAITLVFKQRKKRTFIATWTEVPVTEASEEVDSKQKELSKIKQQEDQQRERELMRSILLPNRPSELLQRELSQRNLQQDQSQQESSQPEQHQSQDVLQHLASDEYVASEPELSPLADTDPLEDGNQNNHQDAPPPPSADHVSINVEALLNAGGFPPFNVLQQDADDETMVELAIALSLQDQGNLEVLPHNNYQVDHIEDLSLIDASPDLPVQDEIPQEAPQETQSQSQEVGQMSDTTASPGVSDDEGSTAAVEGSTLRVSEVEQIVRLCEDEEQEQKVDVKTFMKMRTLKVTLLRKFIDEFDRMETGDAVELIPFFQVIYFLASDLTACEEDVLFRMLRKINDDLHLKEATSPDDRFTALSTDQHRHFQRYRFMLLRLLSVLMYHTKGSSKPQQGISYLTRTIADYLLEHKMIDWCYHIHKKLLPYWKSYTTEETDHVVASLLKPRPHTILPDASPFFLKQYVRSHMPDIFGAYPQLLTEMALRLPYQIQKYSSGSVTFDSGWFGILCDYMIIPQLTPFVRRQVRKLLMHICNGSKEVYRQRRDTHAFSTHMTAVLDVVGINKNGAEYLAGNVSLSYDSLLKIIEHLKACMEIAMARVPNWRRYILGSEELVPHLFILSCSLDEGLSHVVLQLLQLAACGKAVYSSYGITGHASGYSKTEKSHPTTAADVTKEVKSTPSTEDPMNKLFATTVHGSVSKDVLRKFVQMFLFEMNSSILRSEAHFLILTLFRHSDETGQKVIMDLMWSLWPQMPSYGRKAIQYIDLIAYFTMRCVASFSESYYSPFLDSIVSLLRSQNQILSDHPNASFYSRISQYVEMDGYYLESEPCLVCNNPETQYSYVKLSAIKVDCKYTTNTQIIKLLTSHMISRISLRITDQKQNKMVRTLRIYYNNRSVQAIVELKNKSGMWHKAKQVTLQCGQSDVKIDFPLPIVACNLMIEYVDFYENIQITETLTCPRCSASVPANPGVCSNCGENVFQCHKCRSINYDEKDPFLCHICGFCKYAKFDYSLLARPVCAIEPIANEEDRKKVVTLISSLLDKADRLYKQLSANKPALESLLSPRISDHRIEQHGTDEVPTSATSHATQVNKTIQLLAQKYGSDCKNVFDELSRTIQKVLVCRKELLLYDEKQKDGGADTSSSKYHLVSSAVGASGATIPNGVGSGRCYGCATYAVEHCLTTMKVVALNPDTRKYFRKHGLVHELVENNLRKSSTYHLQEEVRGLLCVLVRDSAKATEDLCNLLYDRISMLLRSHIANTDLTCSIKPEVSLLTAIVQTEDPHWEPKAKCVTKLFLLASKECKSPAILEAVIIPCLHIIHSLVKPDPPKSKKYKEKSIDSLATVRVTDATAVNARKWIENDPQHSFKAWKQRVPQRDKSPVALDNKEEVHKRYLMEKYYKLWKERTLQGRFGYIKLIEQPWLKPLMFNSCSKQVRTLICGIIQSCCDSTHKRIQVLNILKEFLSEISTYGHNAVEFLTLFQYLIRQPIWKPYLTLRGTLMHIADLVTKEIQKLHHLEETTLTTDLTQGYSLKKLTELMASFLEVDTIKHRYKRRLMSTILNGYLALRRLVIQRTKLIDETQDKFSEMLEDIISGADADVSEFMRVCIETVQQCEPDDTKTPLFIFERLCSIIYPEENEIGEFYLSLDKDPQQEDFLQGRMLGNPYSSSDPGLGPLMRDVKNKICQDCELVALLEDDTGMELLVNNKIIDLDLPVKEVYKKIWLAEGGAEGEAMRIVYRMRGLLGDATEEFVDTLDTRTEEDKNYEDEYKMANVMADTGGLKVILNCLSSIKELSRSSSPLLQVVLKLMTLCVKVKRNVEALIQPEMNAIPPLLNMLHMLLSADRGNDIYITEIKQVLLVIEAILERKVLETDFKKYSESLVSTEQIKEMLQLVEDVMPSTRSRMMKVIGAMTYGNIEKMATLMNRLSPVFLYANFDNTHDYDLEVKFELFCSLAADIHNTALGYTLKDYIKNLGVINSAVTYITSNAPSCTPREFEEWKTFVSRPSLKYILMFLTGLTMKHPPSQEAITDECISIIHHLEQVSSDEHIGTLAENLLEALRTNPKVASRIENIREQTRAEKKRLAMAMREKQLGALGMRTNEKGQVTATTDSIFKQVDLSEETGLTCAICREGYAFQPSKVLGIYTFTKRCFLEEYDLKPRKSYGYSTVTHFNVVHVECHMAAVRQARGRDEWESAALQNANTRCNGLLPLWGPEVTESAFASCLAKHNTYLQECTGHRDIGYATTVHDLKLLLLRFANEKTFHEDAGGGGPQSNMNLIPYLIHMAAYVINTTRMVSREEANLLSYLRCEDTEKWVTCAYHVEGPYYYLVLSLLLLSPNEWSEHRLAHLNRVLVMAHVRNIHPSGTTELKDAKVKSYSVYKSALIFYGLINMIYKYLFGKLSKGQSTWCSVMADYIRANDEELLKNVEKLMDTYKNELLPCSFFSEFCDVTGLLEEIPSPGTYMSELFNKVATPSTSTSTE